MGSTEVTVSSSDTVMTVSPRNRRLIPTFSARDRIEADSVGVTWMDTVSKKGASAICHPALASEAANFRAWR